MALPADWHDGGLRRLWRTVAVERGPELAQQPPDRRRDGGCVRLLVPPDG